MTTLVRIAAICVGLALPVVASAQVGTADIVVDSPWARATIGVDRPGAIYLTIHNVGEDADTLLHVSTPVAGKAEIHETTTQGGVSRMAPAGPIVVRPGETVVLEPGGLHTMLMDLERALTEGETFQMTLEFEHAGRLFVTVPILGIGALGPSANTE